MRSPDTAASASSLSLSRSCKSPDYITDKLDQMHIPYQTTKKIDEVMPELDFLYMTRVQRERFFNEEDYIRLKDYYILDAAK